MWQSLDALNPVVELESGKKPVGMFLLDIQEKLCGPSEGQFPVKSQMLSGKMSAF